MIQSKNWTIGILQKLTKHDFAHTLHTNHRNEKFSSRDDRDDRDDCERPKGINDGADFNSTAFKPFDYLEMKEVNRTIEQ
jgi:hypothetical protein